MSSTSALPSAMTALTVLMGLMLPSSLMMSFFDAPYPTCTEAFRRMLLVLDVSPAVCVLASLNSNHVTQEMTSRMT